jgi:hypothetical protein
MQVVKQGGRGVGASRSKNHFELNLDSIRNQIRMTSTSTCTFLCCFWKCCCLRLCLCLFDITSFVAFFEACSLYESLSLGLLYLIASDSPSSPSSRSHGHRSHRRDLAVSNQGTNYSQL